jgi:hypothetical protein
MSLSGTNQPYNNAKGGNVDQGKIKCIPQCTGTKVTRNRRSS